MRLPKGLSAARKIVSDNSPLLLTAVGATGVITTAVLASKATVKAVNVLDREEARRVELEIRTHTEGLPVTKREKLDLVWKLYIPAVVSGTMTCSCIIAANVIGNRRAVALAAAYSLSERALSEYKDLVDYREDLFDEYKEKVKEKVGEDQAKAIQDEVTQERINKTIPPLATIMGTGDSLCHDAFTNRYFMCNKETIRKAANDINYQILKSDWATLSDFYKIVNLEPTSVSDEMGWNGENPCEVLFAAIETPDGQPCLSYDFAFTPIRHPWVL